MWLQEEDGGQEQGSLSPNNGCLLHYWAHPQPETKVRQLFTFFPKGVPLPTMYGLGEVEECFEARNIYELCYDTNLYIMLAFVVPLHVVVVDVIVCVVIVCCLCVVLGLCRPSLRWRRRGTSSSTSR